MMTGRRKLQQIHEIKTSLVQSSDTKEIYEKIIDPLFLCLDRMDAGTILLANDDTNKLKKVVFRPRDKGDDSKVYPSRTIVDCVMKEAKALMMADAVRKKETDSWNNMQGDRLRSTICVPLFTKRGIRGVIYVCCTGALQGFRNDDLLFISSLCNPPTFAIENTLLHEENRRSKKALEKARDDLEKVKERTLELMEANRKLNELSITDGGTGLFNHQYFLRALEAEYRRALRYKRSLALLLLDIDHFKEVNDTYGHPCGDLVLKNLAGRVKGCLRSTDIAARCGGDEIAVILPETNKSKASEVAEKLRRQLEKSSFEWDGNSFNITCSIGVAAIPGTGIDNWNELLNSADKCLYRAKGKGRNNVIAFNSDQVRRVPRGSRSPRRRALAVH